MDTRQRRLWRRMLRSVGDFRAGRIRFRALVSELEGAIDASEFRDEELVHQFYDAWGPLEVVRATQGDDVDASQINAELAAMEKFLTSSPWALAASQSAEGDDYLG